MNDAARMPCLVDHYAFTKDLVAPQGMNVLQPASAPDSFWQTLEKFCSRSGRPSFFRSGLPRASPATDKWHSGQATLSWRDLIAVWFKSARQNAVGLPLARLALEGVGVFF